METEVLVLPATYPTEGASTAPHAYFVYFLYCAGRVKIGKANAVNQRVSEYATGCPFQPIVLLAISGTRWSEGELHTRFAEDRRHREWFRLSDHLRRYIVKRLDAEGLAAFRKAEDDFLNSFLPEVETPRKWKKPKKRCNHGKPLSKPCAQCTRETDMRVYYALVEKMRAEEVTG